MSQTAPLPATAQLLHVLRPRHPAGCLLCSSSTSWSREIQRWLFHPPSLPFTSGADDANYPPHKAGGLQPHMVLGIPEPEAAGAVQSPKRPRLSRRASTAHTHTKRETAALRSVAENWALSPLLLLCCAKDISGSSNGLWDGGLCEQSTVESRR